MSIKANLVPKHPGGILQRLYLAPLNMSAGKLAKAIDVPRTRIERIVKGDTGITADTALRLGRYFDTTPELWMNMQAKWDVFQASQKLEKASPAIVPLNAQVTERRELECA